MGITKQTLFKPFTSAWRWVASLGKKKTPPVRSQPERVVLGNFVAFAYSGGLDHMDDRAKVGINPNRIVLGDGMGGYKDSALSAQVTVDTADNDLSKRFSTPPAAVLAALQANLDITHASVLEVASQLPKVDDKACTLRSTLTLFVEMENTGYVASVGDSPAFLVQPNAEGKYLDENGIPFPESFQFLTPDHSVGFNIALRAQALTFPCPWDIWANFSDHAYTGRDAAEKQMLQTLSQGIGYKIDNAHLLAVPLQPGDVVGVISDGILKPFWEFYGNRENGTRQFAIMLCTFLEQGLSTEEIGARITQWCLENNPSDNLAIALYRKAK